MKNFRKILTIFILYIIYIYVFYLDVIPSHAIIYEGEKISLNTIFGITINDEELLKKETREASINLSNNRVKNDNNVNLKVSLFNTFNVKNLSVDVIKKTKVIPMGCTVGIELHADGVLVVGLTEIEGEKPYEKSGIHEGDKIIAVNNEKIFTTDELINKVNESNGQKIKITYKRGSKQIDTYIQPIKTQNNEYKLGIWVRDDAAGIGTITFYEPDSKKFAALGHAITDIDTSEIIPIGNGKLIETNIISITRGEQGAPGELKGIINESTKLGEILKNTKYGIYGKIYDQNKFNLDKSNEMEVALRNEIHEGKAEILCQLQDDEVDRYEIEIQKLFMNNNENNKSMFIKVTDQSLIDKTGGIIQGMSGAPIIQDGKFVGAVTHVLVNDPLQGYGVFADIMLKEIKDI